MVHLIFNNFSDVLFNVLTNNNVFLLYLAVVMMSLFGAAAVRRVKIPIFTADHPFMFAIIHKKLRLVCFSGRAIY